MRRKSDWVSVKSELRKGIIVVIITRRHFEMQDGCCHPFRVTTGSDGRVAGMWVRFKSVKWFAEGGDGCDQRKALYHAGDEKQIEQIDKGSRIRGGGQLRGPAEKRNPEHRGCVEDRDMTAETKIALCGHTAHFHFMSQYPIYTHTYTHPYSHIFAMFRRHYTLTQMRIKTQICTHKQKHTPVLIYSHTYFHHIVFFFFLFHFHDLILTNLSQKYPIYSMILILIALIFLVQNALGYLPCHAIIILHVCPEN